MKLGRKDKEEKTKSDLKNITINIPDTYDGVIQKLKELKITPSRSEAIRTALREFLQVELENFENMDKFVGEKS